MFSLLLLATASPRQLGSHSGGHSDDAPECVATCYDAAMEAADDDAAAACDDIKACNLDACEESTKYEIGNFTAGGCVVEEHEEHEDEQPEGGEGEGEEEEEEEKADTTSSAAALLVAAYFA